MQLNKREEIIISFLRARGPLLPIQIAKKIGIDSLTTSALLSSLAKSGKIRSSFKLIGSSKLFYLRGQEEIAREMLSKYLTQEEKELIQRVERANFLFEDQLTKREKSLARDLLDFIQPIRVSIDREERICWKHHSVSLELLRSLLEQAPEKPPAPKPPVAPKVPEVFKAEGILERAKGFLSQLGARIVEEKEIRKRKEASLVVEFPSPLEQRYFVKIKGKRRITTSDLSLAFAEGSELKMPVIFITGAKISRSVKEFTQRKFGNLMRIVRME
jgi:DNA-binding MarR family transcriptional regulator